MILLKDSVLYIKKDNGNIRYLKVYDTIEQAEKMYTYIKRHWTRTKRKIVELAYFLESDTKNIKGTYDYYTVIVKKNKDVYVFLERKLIDKWNLNNF